jgi:uncharacterized protein (TIGR03435 family)
MKAALLLLLPAAVFAQSGTPSFAVTSVKLDKSDDFSRRSALECSPGGRFVSRGNLLIQPIKFAWNVPAMQVSGMPAWAALAGLSGTYFEIEARSEGPVTLDQCRLMVQALLADRFKLKIHHESKKISVYALVVGGTKPKLKEADASKPGVGARINGGTMRAPDGREMLTGWTMASFADALTPTTRLLDGRSVVDRTGLKGVYEFNLQFDPNPNLLAHGDLPDVFVAVEEQLGLKLKERKEPFDMIVVDHIEKPSQN